MFGHTPPGGKDDKIYDRHTRLSTRTCQNSEDRRILKIDHSERSNVMIINYLNNGQFPYRLNFDLSETKSISTATKSILKLVKLYSFVTKCCEIRIVS